MKRVKNIKITGLDHYGRGISKIDEKVVFINNALPDEIVDIVIRDYDKKIVEAGVINHLSYSSERVIPECQYYSECGGCNIMHLNYQSQLKFKENKVKEIMKKFADIDGNIIKSIIKTDEFFYRNKVTLQVKEKLGFYKRKSYEIIEIDNCIISDKSINKVINILQDINLKNIKQVSIKSSLFNNEIMVIFDVIGVIDEKEIKDKLPDVNIIIKVKDKYSVVQGKSHIIEEIGGYNFYISPESFFQVNTKGTLILYELVLKYANLTGSEKVLDLYCGTGSIGIFLAKYAKEVLGIEINRQAIEDANKNKILNKVENISFEQGDVSEVLERISILPDIIVVDPPRSGLNCKILDEIFKLSPKRLVYVSCDPVTLARDLKILKKQFNIIEITPVDMFANTHHVETVVLMSRKK